KQQAPKTNIKTLNSRNIAQEVGIASFTPSDFVSVWFNMLTEIEKESLLEGSFGKIGFGYKSDEYLQRRVELVIGFT
ncbi:16335_t:CDS:1, partial [Acaulospora morrowiae]